VSLTDTSEPLVHSIINYNIYYCYAGWWYVEDHHGRSGWVPATYLRPILDNNQKRPEGSENITGSTMKVLQAHKSDQDDELTVSRGESVEVILVTSDGWWIVRNNETGFQGLIPSVCLTQEPDPATIVEEDSPDNQSTSSDGQNDTSAWGDGKLSQFFSVRNLF